jgi:hypothetical protein
VRKVREAEEEEKNNKSVNRGLYICHAARLQRRTSSACTLLGPILTNLNFHNLKFQGNLIKGLEMRAKTKSQFSPAADK